MQVTGDWRNKCTYMKLLTTSYRIRLSNDDINLINELKRLRIKPTTFIRQAFREKLDREMKSLLEKEAKEKSKTYIPF